MASIRVGDFLKRSIYVIPKYQRGFAWEKGNIRELFEDIKEAIAVDASHYIGTIVLSKTSNNEIFDVVDGQQRITTITMIINALIGFMKKDDAIFNKRLYIEHSDKFRLVPLGREKEFFKSLLTNGVKDLEPVNRSQRLLVEVYQEITEILKELTKEIEPIEYLKKIENLQIMEFVENSEGDAIRIFQTVNDRGKPLTNMEKAKSLLVYFSNRYIDKKLDKKINIEFGKIFEIYDQIKHCGSENDINLISGNEFNEDNIMRYHCITFDRENYDPSAGFVLQFLKDKLGELRKRSTAEKDIEVFINEYVDSLHEFFRSLNELIQKTETDVRYYKLFSILGLSTTLYPVITVLNSQKLLEKNLQNEDYREFTFFDLIEIIDVRIYKVKYTNPQKDISRLSYDIIHEAWSSHDIENYLINYNSYWMSEDEFRTKLCGSIYTDSSRVLPMILLDYSEYLSRKQFDLRSLKNLAKSKSLTIEHILSQKPKFTLNSHGFKSTDEYLEIEHTLGNLTLLEKSINSSVNNKRVSDKIPYYDKSKFKMTRTLSTQIAHKNQFKKKDIETRTEEIANYLIEKWWG